MIRLKDDSINVAHLNTGILLGLIVADQVLSAYGYETVITSGNDARHSKTSLHYANNAVDLRTMHIRKEQLEEIRNEIASRLNQDWDVVLEIDHIHLECQPRRRL